MDTQNDSHETEGGILSVTNNYISFGGTIIPIRNICRLQSYQIRKKYGEAFNLTLILIAAIAGTVISAFYKIKILPLILVVVAVVSVVAIIRSLKFRRYGLSIETNGGTKNFLMTKSKQFSIEVLGLLREIFDNLENPASYTVNMDNRIIEGDSIKQVGHFDVGVQK